MMQAVGAMFRGETPQQFLKNLANTNPQLKELDLSGDLDAAAKDLYQKKGEDYDAAKSTIRDKIGQLMAK